MYDRNFVHKEYLCHQFIDRRVDVIEFNQYKHTNSHSETLSWLGMITWILF